MAVEIKPSEFQDKINSGLVLVDFWAPWCGPCKMLGPVIAELAEELKGTIEVCKLNMDDDDGTITEKFDIMSIPTLILFKNGQMIAKRTGMTSKKIIKDWIEENSK